MTRFEVATLSLRLAAIYVGLHDCFILSTWVVFLSIPGDHEFTRATLAGSLVTALLLALFSALLLARAPALARRMFGDPPSATFDVRSDVGALALALAGIVLWDRALHGISRSVFGARTIDTLGWDDLGGAIGAVLVPAAAGSLFFAARHSIARRLFGSRAQADSSPALAQVQAVAFSVIGLWILADALPDLGSAFRVLKAMEEPSVTDGFLAALLRTLLGLVLFVSGPGLSSLWRRIRTAGLDRPRPSGT